MNGRIGELLIILFIIILLFGAGKLPEVIHDINKSIKSLGYNKNEGADQKGMLGQATNLVLNEIPFHSVLRLTEDLILPYLGKNEQYL